MSQLFLQISVSLDGYIEDATGNIDWMVFDASVDPFATQTLESIDGMIFGRKAHGLLAAFWPGAAESEGATAELIRQTRLMNALPKYVLTHGEETTGWANSHAIRSEDVPRLKREAARPLAVFAGAGAAQSLLARGDIDEIRLLQYPVLLGGGTSLFARDGRRQELELIESRAFESGATLQRYRWRSAAAMQYPPAA
jgi:dihydrofolate reductase